MGSARCGGQGMRRRAKSWGPRWARPWGGRPARRRTRTCGRARLAYALALGSVKTFDRLYAELTDIATTRPAGSGTVRALDAGIHTIGKKIVEEAAEVWMAAEYQSDAATAEEISQLLYHLQVLMIAKGISLDDVYAYL